MAAVGARTSATPTDADLEAFCLREHPRLVAALHLLCGDRQVAEDLAQETLVRVWDRWERVRMLESPGGWAHHVALNLLRSHARRRRVERRWARNAASSLTTVEVAPEDPDDRVRAALLTLPDREREIIVLRFHLDHSVAETAAVLGVPDGTVKSATARALGRLRSVLGDATLGDDDV